MITIAPALAGIPVVMHRSREYRPHEVWLTGCRWLVEYHASTATDAEQPLLWGDLRTSHGLYTPLLFDPVEKSTHGETASAPWWADSLPELIQGARVKETTLTVERLRPAEPDRPQIFLNTLDFIFGHALLVLLSAQHYLDAHATHDLVVVIQPALRSFVPAGVAEVWQADLPFSSDVMRWHEPLAERFRARCQEHRAGVAIARTVSVPTRYDLARFGLGRRETAEEGKTKTDLSPRIAFTFRGSRYWGGSFDRERRRLARLGQHLRCLWPAAQLEIHGFATPPRPVPGWRDRTLGCADGPAEDYNAWWTDTLRSVDLVLGAYGSNMLRPTAVSGGVIELVPLDKQPFILQECLIEENAAPRELFWRLRLLYGDGTLSNIAPRQVAHLSHSMLTLGPWFEVYQSTVGSDPGMSEENAAALSARFTGDVGARVRAWQEGTAKLTTRGSWFARATRWLERKLNERD